jgi:hypothetical protein
MIEYQDGSFSEIMAADEAIKRLTENFENVRSVHFGSLEELARRRNMEHVSRKTVPLDGSPSDERVSELADRIENLERRMNGEIAIHDITDLARFENKTKGLK